MAFFSNRPATAILQAYSITFYSFFSFRYFFNGPIKKLHHLNIV